MLAVNADEELIVGRILEYVGWSVPWQRRLWNVGSVAALHELGESAEAVAASTLSESALKSLCRDVGRLIGPDPGIGSPELRQHLSALLRTPLRAHGVDWHELRDATALAADGYLARWSVAFEAGGNRPGNEHAARLIAAHLMWLGFSGDAIHRWLTYQSRHSPGEHSLADVLQLAQEELATRHPQRFEVLIPCLAAPRIDVPGAAPPSWLDGPTLAQKLQALPRSSGVAHNGGFRLEVEALDPGAAAVRARETIDRWSSRVELSTPGTLQLSGPIWVDGTRSRHLATGARRSVEVGALQRENLIYAELHDDPTSLQVDDALQLARPLETGGVAAAIAGGWAAIESLLVRGDEPKVKAAQRLASIIACSYPRAELTTLAYLHEKNGSDQLAGELADAESNRERAQLATHAIRADALSPGSSIADRAALERMKAVLEAPRETLGRVRQHIADALHRLYRQRNLIVHGGRVSGHLRTATLEGAPSLVGAGLDRIAHSWFVDQRSPLQLAAMADLSLALVGSSAGRPVTDLLEP